MSIALTTSAPEPNSVILVPIVNGIDCESQ
jgi:hypothetical protein